MADIKLKESNRGTIKTLNKALIVTEKTKENILRTRDFAQGKNNENAEEYATNNTETAIKNSIEKGTRTFNQQGRKSVDRVNQDIRNMTNKVNNYKIKQAEKRLLKNTKSNIKTARKTTKTTGKSIKAATKSSKKAIKTADKGIKTAQKTAKATAKASKRAMQTAKATARASAKAIKLAIKATISAIKAIIASVKSLISIIAAGGWVAVLIIIIICMVGMIAGSVYGIFFSKELKGKNGEVTIGYVSLMLETEMNAKITGIKAINIPYGGCEVIQNKAPWRDILAVYAVRANGGNNQQEVMTLDKKREKLLRDTYWDMNAISWNKTLDREKLLKLTITIRGKSVQEISNQYKFNDEQRKMLDEILNGKYDDAWNNAIGSTDIVKVAESQLGNKGRRTLLELVWV